MNVSSCMCIVWSKMEQGVRTAFFLLQSPPLLQCLIRATEEENDLLSLTPRLRMTSYLLQVCVCGL